MRKYEFTFTIIGYDLLYHLIIEGIDIDEAIEEFKRKTFIDGIDYGTIDIYDIRRLPNDSNDRLHDRYENFNKKKQ